MGEDDNLIVGPATTSLPDSFVTFVTPDGRLTVVGRFA
jgi:hypothetical protein